MNRLLLLLTVVLFSTLTTCRQLPGNKPPRPELLIGKTDYQCCLNAKIARTWSCDNVIEHPVANVISSLEHDFELMKTVQTLLTMGVNHTSTAILARKMFKVEGCSFRTYNDVINYVDKHVTEMVYILSLLYAKDGAYRDISPSLAKFQSYCRAPTGIVYETEHEKLESFMRDHRLLIHDIMSIDTKVWDMIYGAETSYHVRLMQAGHTIMVPALSNDTPAYNNNGVPVSQHLCALDMFPFVLSNLDSSIDDTIVAATRLMCGKKSHVKMGGDIVTFPRNALIGQPISDNIDTVLFLFINRGTLEQNLEDIKLRSSHSYTSNPDDYLLMDFYRTVKLKGSIDQLGYPWTALSNVTKTFWNNLDNYDGHVPDFNPIDIIFDYPGIIGIRELLAVLEELNDTKMQNVLTKFLDLDDNDSRRVLLTPYILEPDGHDLPKRYEFEDNVVNDDERFNQLHPSDFPHYRTKDEL